MWMSLIGGADFSSRGTSFSEVLKNTSVNWPLNSSACSVSDQTTTISPFDRRDTLIVFPLTDSIPIKVFGVNLNVINQFVNIQIMLLLDISFDLLSQFLKLRSEFTTASLFCLSMSFVPFSNIPSNLWCNPRDGSYRSTCLRGNVLIYSLLYERSYQIEVFLN